MYRYPFLTLLVCVLVSATSTIGLGQTSETNPLFKEAKVKNYLPHMSWKEVEEALERTDMVIIPVGSIEQHGKHLPLGTDTYGAIEASKLIAQKTDVLVAPAVFAGLSEHHMGFPGTLTLRPETFEAVVFDAAKSLIHHGFTKIMIYNGHGGNTTSVTNVIQKINQTTPATAVFLNDLAVPEDEDPEPAIPYDWHAGEGETSYMLYMTPSLVDMSRAEKPVLTFPPIVERSKRAGIATYNSYSGLTCSVRKPPERRPAPEKCPISAFSLQVIPTMRRWTGDGKVPKEWSKPPLSLSRRGKRLLIELASDRVTGDFHGFCYDRLHTLLMVFEYFVGISDNRKYGNSE